MQAQMALVGLSTLMILVSLLSLVTPESMSKVPEALLKLLVLLTTVALLATVTLPMLEVHVVGG